MVQVATQAPPPPPPVLPQPLLQQQHQQQQQEYGAALAGASNLHPALPAAAGMPAMATVLAVDAASSTSTLPALLSRCCRSPEAAAVGLTPKLVGAFVAAYSGHFTPVQRQDAADWVEALASAGQLEAVKSYLEGMAQRYGVSF